MNKSMNILVQSSDYYAPYLGVMLTSLFENNKKEPEVQVFLMTSDMSQKNRDKFLALGTEYQRKIEFIDAGKIDLMLVEAGALPYHGSYATYYKIFAPSILPKSIDRLLYLDADMLILDSLSEMYHCEFKEEEMLAMCQTITVPSCYVKRLTGENGYYNAASIVFNIEEWRNSNATETVMQHLKNIRSAYPFAEETLINLLFYQRIKKLPLRYDFAPVALIWKNWTLHKVMYRLEGCNEFCDEEEFEQALENPAVMHYTALLMDTRPWYSNADIPEMYWVGREEWRKYWEKSLWNDCLPKEYKLSFRSKGVLFCHRHLSPKTFANLYGYLFTKFYLQILKRHGL